jgi:hypothetical protein
MSRAAKSVLVFAGYMLLLGASLALVPARSLALAGLGPAPEPWVRLLGVLVLCLAYYYVVAARRESASFMRACVRGRAFVAACIVVLAALGLAPVQLLLFAAIDAAGAAWTQVALRRG